MGCPEVSFQVGHIVVQVDRPLVSHLMANHLQVALLEAHPQQQAHHTMVNTTPSIIPQAILRPNNFEPSLQRTDQMLILGLIHMGPLLTHLHGFHATLHQLLVEGQDEFQHQLGFESQANRVVCHQLVYQSQSRAQFAQAPLDSEVTAPQQDQGMESLRS